MYLSVISRLVFIVIALLVLASCDHGGSKVEAGKAKEVKLETNSSPANSKKISPAKPAATAAATKNAVDDNGITQFNSR